MSDSIIVLFLLFIIWYWWDSTRAKEDARRAGKKACDEADLQFLDDTVARQKIWLKRNNRGHVIICRSYYFEFANQGDTRYKGEIILLGKYIDSIQMEAYKI